MFPEITEQDINGKLELPLQEPRVSTDPKTGKPSLLEPPTPETSSPYWSSPPIRINPQSWSSCPLSLVGASQPRCGLCSFRSALRAGPNSAAFVGSSACRARGLAPGLRSAVGDELPWMGVMAVSAELGRAR